MKSLRSYHARASVKAEILDLLRDAEILLTKELFYQCESALDKARELASVYEYDHLLLEILNTRRNLELARGSSQGGSLRGRRGYCRRGEHHEQDREPEDASAHQASSRW